MDADQLPHTLSHDLRGPLMAISGAAELISAIAAPGDRRSATGVIRFTATSVMERLIHDLLEVGSFEDAQLRLAPRIARPERARAWRAVDAFQQAASAKNISLDARLPAGGVAKSRVRSQPDRSGGLKHLAQRRHLHAGWRIDLACV